jgi:hypothetical protein
LRRRNRCGTGNRNGDLSSSSQLGIISSSSSSSGSGNSSHTVLDSTRTSSSSLTVNSTSNSSRNVCGAASVVRFDPSFSRYVVEHSDEGNLYGRALREIREGRKRSCWMWYFLPTPPFVVNGEERGSFQNKQYCIRSANEAKAFLAFRSAAPSLSSSSMSSSASWCVREVSAAGTGEGGVHLGRRYKKLVEVCVAKRSPSDKIQQQRSSIPH